MKALRFSKDANKFEVLAAKEFKKTLIADPFTFRHFYGIRIDAECGIFMRDIDTIDFTPNFIVAYSIEPDNDDWCIMYNDEAGIEEAQVIEKFESLDLISIKKWHNSLEKENAKTF